MAKDSLVITTQMELGKAKEYIKNYGIFSRNINQEHILRSFTISYQDLIHVLKLPKDAFKEAQYHYVRAYMAMEDPEHPKADNVHLLLTPVNDENKDVILGNKESGFYVYDLITPCPKTCDTTSQLYQAFYTIESKTQQP